MLLSCGHTNVCKLGGGGGGGIILLYVKKPSQNAEWFNLPNRGGGGVRVGGRGGGVISTSE